MQRFQLARGLGNQKLHFPMSGVKTQRDGPAVFSAQTAVRAENQKFRIEQPRRLPAHPRILTKPKEISRRLFQQHLRRQRKRTGRARRMGRDISQLRSVRLQYRLERNVLDYGLLMLLVYIGVALPCALGYSCRS